MMNQKFSQLNRDYVKTVPKKQDASTKESMRTGIGWMFLGVLTGAILLLVFYMAKKPAIKKVEAPSVAAVSVEKVKPKVKHSKKPKVVAKEEQEYGFYTMLPKMEVKVSS